MDKLCKNCKYWTKDGHIASDLVQLYEPVSYRTLTDEEMKQLSGRLVRYCESPKLLFYERPLIDGVTVVDGSGYMAGLITGEEFGCVNFESL